MSKAALTEKQITDFYKLIENHEADKIGALIDQDTNYVYTQFYKEQDGLRHNALSYACSLPVPPKGSDAREKYSDTLLALINNGCEVTATAYQNVTPLMVAARNEKAGDLIPELLRYAEAVFKEDATEEYKITDTAAIQKYADAQMLKYVNAVNNDGSSALHWSAKRWLVTNTEYLLARSASPHAKNLSGHTPADLLVKAFETHITDPKLRKYEMCVELLSKLHARGAAIPTSEGITPKIIELIKKECGAEAAPKTQEGHALAQLKPQPITSSSSHVNAATKSASASMHR